jgi:hypothetical protein
VALIFALGVGLGAEDIENLLQETVLYNEVHALAFCSEKVRQIDFTNTFKQLPVRSSTPRPPHSPLSVQFLSPIFHLLEAGATKCNRLLLGGNELSQADISSLSKFVVESQLNRTITDCVQSIYVEPVFSKLWTFRGVAYVT